MDQQNTTIATTTTTIHDTTDEFAAIWWKRFDFFDAYGPQTSTPEARHAFRAMPAFERFRIGSNVLAFTFGALYFFAKGMWRKGLTLVVVGAALQVAAAVLDAPQLLQTAVGYGMSAIAMSTANYAYYLHVTTGSTSWNPFEGLGRR